MLRLVHLAVLPGMLLVACSAWVHADAIRPSNRVATENKPKYSNRPAGYSVPTPYYGTPMAPRFLVPPAAQYRQVAMAPTVGEPETEFRAVPKTLEALAPQVVERTFILREPKPEMNVSDELDAFYARLAKIRLEQHQLDEALVFIQKIKSETFKVRTIVDLAEYVSRDKSFQKEADQLFRLALTAMEALDRGQPVRLGTGSVQDAQPSADTPVVVPSDAGGVPQPVLMDPAPSVVTPPPTVDPRPSIPDATPTVEPPAVSPGVPPTVDPPETSPGVPPPRPPLVLPDAAGRGNGRLPPPSPPQGNGVDGGIVTSPPETRPPVSPEVAPPARTTEANGSTPQTSPDSSTTIPTQDSPPNKRPAAIPLEDEKTEPEKPPQRQTPTPRPPVIILEEN